MTTAAEADTGPTVSEFAPAKVNLALHITGRRADGYHLLDSLVVFAPVGDRVTVAPAETLALTVTGAFADTVPRDGTNLVLLAAQALGRGRGAAITLEKTLPPASGLGGGSADAAAALRALARLWGVALPAPEVVLALGADVPVCLAGRAARMQGIGERMTPLPGPVPVHLLLVNPRVAVSTAAVFAGLSQRDNPALPEIPALTTARQLAAFAASCRNDLEAPALRLAPVIGDALAAIGASEGVLLARMSGSGATCFGLYPDAALRDAARKTLADEHPEWWVS